jgi:hypothetical protein
MSSFPQGDEWKNPAFVEAWKRDRRESLEQKWRKRQLDEMFRPSEIDRARDSGFREYESFGARADRIEPPHRKKQTRGISVEQARKQIPDMLTRTAAGEWIVSEIGSRATPEKLAKSKKMWELGLHRKAQRELACGLLGGAVSCLSGHVFFVPYKCGNRYCPLCAPSDGKKLFARQLDRLRFVATRLMMCGEECEECSRAIEEKRVPHWPPERGVKPRVVCAKLDFTVRHDKADGMPTPERMRELNRLIRKFCRTIEKRFHISRKEYGLAYCDELGGSNSNPHAHAIYVGPWLPQERKELSKLWSEITGGSFILSIKYARDFNEAVFHAIKYPAKFAVRSTPDRLAELEAVFHRVRRFHTLAAFYAPECPEPEKPGAKKCPLCGDLLTEPKGWEPVYVLKARGLRSIEEIEKERAREGIAGPPRAPPIYG